MENCEQELSKLAIEEDGDVVNPWSVTSSSQEGVDYDKLISKSHRNNMF